jgi:NAD(P)-dependent dehydrogenase (short-subunit alcohol dehydrogenase family)
MSRRIMVTGAAGGFGWLISADLVARGHRVGLVDLDGPRLAELETELKALAAGEVLALPTDLADTQARARAIAAVESAWGGIDAVVNTAGLGPGVRPDFFTNPIRSHEITEDHIRRSLEVNALAPVMLCLEVLPGMKERNWGRLINVTTGLGTMVREGFLTYGPSKAALEAASAVLAKEVEGSGVTVNVVVPGGAADTPMVPPESRGTVKLIPAEAMVPPIAYLLTDDAGTANGIRIVASEWDLAAPPDPGTFDPAAW